MSKLKSQICISNLKSFKFLAVILSFAFCVLSLATKAVYGQSLSLGIYPPLLEVTIQPGKSITQVYKLYNNGETDLALTSQVVPFKPADEQGNTLLLPKVAIDTNLPGWFSFQNADLDLGQKFILKAGKEQEIVLKIRIPPEAKEDDYYLTLLFETTPGVDLYLHPGGVSLAEAKIGSNILLTVSETGEPPRKAEIEEFKIQNSKFKIIDSFSKPQFILRVKNTGQSFFKPLGTITVTGWFGQKYLLDILPENVLTNSIRQIQCQGEEQAIPCQLESKFLLGPYKAKVEFGLDKVSQDYTAELIFWAIPSKLTITFLTIFLILFIIKSKFKIKN